MHGVSNNPFIDDPTTAPARFPDLSPSPSQFQPAYPPPQYPYPPQHQLFLSTPQHPPPPLLPPQPTGLGPSAFQLPTPPQPTRLGPGAAFQQHPPPQQYLAFHPGYPYPGVYPQQTTTGPPAHLAEFDPYAQQQQQQQQSHTAAPPSSAGPGPPGHANATHPRDLIRVHKSALEAWNARSWKQLFDACDALRDAWSARRLQAEGAVRQFAGTLGDPRLRFAGTDAAAFGYNQSQVQGWNQVLKDASNNVDTVAASTIQLHEVFNSYRHSGDPASKQRVRESCNAAMKGLPDWPSN